MWYVNFNIHEQEWNRKENSFHRFCLFTAKTVFYPVSNRCCCHVTASTKTLFAHRLRDECSIFGDRERESEKMCGLLKANTADIISPTDIRVTVCVRVLNMPATFIRATRDNLNKFSFYRSSFMSIFFTLFFCVMIFSRLLFSAAMSRLLMADVAQQNDIHNLLVVLLSVVNIAKKSSNFALHNVLLFHEVRLFSTWCIVGVACASACLWFKLTVGIVVLRCQKNTCVHRIWLGAMCHFDFSIFIRRTFIIFVTENVCIL